MNPVSDLLQAIDQQDLQRVEHIVQTAFEQHADQEVLLANVAGIVFEKEVHPLFRYIDEFVNRFPDSLHPIRVFLGDLLARQGLYDAASVEARVYLRLAKDSGVLKPTNDAILGRGIGQGFLLLTAGHTTVGARSYSKRVLELGKQMASPSWVESYQEELVQLDAELSDPENKALDDQWEAFYQSGKFADELIAHAQKLELHEIAQRTELLEARFRYDANFRVPASEMLQLVYKENEAFMLG